MGELQTTTLQDRKRWPKGRGSRKVPATEVSIIAQHCYRCTELDIPAIIRHGLVRPFPLEKRKDWSAAIVQRQSADQQHQGLLAYANDCPSCRALWKRHQQFVLEPAAIYRQNANVTELLNGQDAKFYFETGRLYGMNITGASSVEARIFLRPLHTSNVPSLHISVDNPNDIAPAPDFDKIRSWLTECESHAECARAPASGVKGMKLIKVRDRRVVPRPERCEYLTLSYVWGGVQQPSCDETGKIPSDVPLTIEHAMKATDRLGFQYLWVDALCIDQANGSEKQEQINMMDVIYEEAFATIVDLDGANANSGLGGLRRDRFPRIIVRFGKNLFRSCEESLAPEIEASVWNRRGWTFQETLLSRRLLFFTERQAYFMCDRKTYSESLDDEYRSETSLGIQHDRIFRQTRAVNLDQLTMNVQKLHVFADTMTNYLCRELSFDGDALSAVSGLLYRLSKKLFPPNGSIYGVPRFDLRGGLLWRANRGDMFRRDCSSVPSWSWIAWHHPATKLRFFECELHGHRQGPQPPLYLHDRLGNTMPVDYGSTSPGPSRSRAVNLAISHRPQTAAMTTPGVPKDTGKRVKQLQEVSETLLSCWSKFQQSAKVNHTLRNSKPEVAGAFHAGGIVLTLPCRPYDPIMSTESDQYSTYQLDRFWFEKQCPRIEIHGTRHELRETRQSRAAKEECNYGLARMSGRRDRPIFLPFLLVQWEHAYNGSTALRHLFFDLLMLDWDENGHASRAGVCEIAMTPLFDDMPGSEFAGALELMKPEYMEFWLI